MVGAPPWAAAHPCYEHPCPDPTLSFRDFLVPGHPHPVEYREGGAGSCRAFPQPSSWDTIPAVGAVPARILSARSLGVVSDKLNELAVSMGPGIMRPRTRYDDRGTREPNRLSDDDFHSVVVTSPLAGGSGSV